jgi:hypothetical protein
MRSETKWERRDKKRNKKRYGMRVDGRSIFTITRKMKKDASESRPDEAKRSTSKTQ